MTAFRRAIRRTSPRCSVTSACSASGSSCSRTAATSWASRAPLRSPPRAFARLGVRAAGVCRRPVPFVIAFLSLPPPFSVRPRGRPDSQVQGLLLPRGRRCRRGLRGAVVVRRHLRLVDVAAHCLARAGVAAVLALVRLRLALVTRLVRRTTCRGSWASRSPASAWACSARRACSSRRQRLRHRCWRRRRHPSGTARSTGRCGSCSTPTHRPSGSCSTALQHPLATFTGALCSAFDSAVAYCVVLFEFVASCDWVTSPP